MGRPRIGPRVVQRPNGMFYAKFRDPITGRLQKASLGTRDRKDAESALTLILAEKQGTSGWTLPEAPGDFVIEKWARKMCKRARENASAKHRIYALAWEDVADLMRKQGFRCAVTRFPFSFDLTRRRNPYAPSLDQVVAGAGYTLENVRLTLVLVNTAMNEWGEKPLLDLLSFARWGDFPISVTSP